MQDQKWHEIRLRFSKTGRAKYIGHLDVNRVMSRALRRAGIPLWFTEGYNPHAYMRFSLPLSLGVESACESMDIRLIEPMEHLEVQRRMNAALPPDIQIEDVFCDFRDCTEIAFSDYDFTLAFDDNAAGAEKLQAVLDAPQILALKKGKVGRKRVMKEVDIKTFIDRYRVELTPQGVVLHLRLAAGQEKNLNPTLLCDTLLRLVELPWEWKRIYRLDLLDKDYQPFQ